MDLARDRAAADLGAGLEHDRLQARLWRDKRRRQAVVSGADDDDRLHVRRSARIRVAAFRPGAPMIPPPGCVAEPHM